MAISNTQSPAPEPAESLDVVETPTSPSSGLARSRFEFETDKRNEGTKILMVEWDDSGPRQENESSDWEVTWEAKGAVLPVRDVEPEAGSNIRRVYFLLPPGAPVPALVDITRRRGSSEDGAGAGHMLRTKPMPAIFPAELTSQQDAGRRGVLHTIWAKRRLAELQAEIAAEMRTNGESVGLEMAMQEQQWIVDHFGLAPDPGMPQPTKLHIPQSSASPASPRSPVGGRLGEKLRGLKLATSPADLAAASQAAKSAQAPRMQPLVTSVSPPATGVSTVPGSSGGGVASLDAIVGSGVAPVAAARVDGGDDATEEDLFALPMSPRSPEMKRSPFSIL
ncbi:hypothetical protein C8A01DRAFT_12086 [Parachaetomium inaequale]|uniref:Uncharacterized protein n=1 Tax=Parachaetomium inaequale TaxID=2588326 RepID=A0AAN6SWF6_9PEZI|nr:hypothetical protein C8A01DRAFT_12086 [Parachaetomium inaequale]